MLALCGHTWWRKPAKPGKTTDLGQATTTLPHADTRIRSRALRINLFYEIKNLILTIHFGRDIRKIEVLFMCAFFFFFFFFIFCDIRFHTSNKQNAISKKLQVRFYSKLECILENHCARYTSSFKVFQTVIL